MQKLEGYEKFNSDLRRMFATSIRRGRIDVQKLGLELGFSICEINQILNWPVTVPGCDMAKVVMRLGLIDEFYKAFFKRIPQKNVSVITLIQPIHAAYPLTMTYDLEQLTEIEA